eukprot:UC4_evm1s494
MISLAVNHIVSVIIAATISDNILDTIPDTIRAVRVDNNKPCGPPDFGCIKVDRIKTPQPQVGEVLIRLASSYLEEKLGKIQGTIGVDFSGIVVAVGPLVSRIKVGDREYISVLEALVGIAPKNIDLLVAGTIPEVATTSFECLKDLGAPWAQKNVSAVITSGSGGTGYIGIQIAKAMGAAHIATATSGADNIAFVKSLGADLVTDYKKQIIWSILHDNSIDVVYDNYGGKGTADLAMPKMHVPGIFLLLPGGQNGQLSKHPKEGVKQIKFGLMKPNLSSLNSIRDLFEQEKLFPHVYRTFSFDNVSEAFALSVTGTVVGKIA